MRGESCCFCVAVLVLALWASLVLTCVLFFLVQCVFHLFCVLFAVGDLSDGAAGSGRLPEGRRGEARRCVSMEENTIGR